MPEYEDMTPTWTEILPLILNIYDTAPPFSEARANAEKELKSMAGLADRLNEIAKKTPA